MKRQRPTWDEYALILAQAASSRSEDPWRQVGAAVLRHDNSTAATGYNGAPPGIVVDWSNRAERQKYAIHAERNCLSYVKPGECRLIACTYLPCADCLKEISIKKIRRVIYEKEYELNGLVSTTEDIRDLAKLFQIELIHLPLSTVK